MTCPMQTRENVDLLLAYCARRLDPDTAAMLERHMDVCPECRAFGQAQQAVWNALDAWEAMPVAADFDRRLYHRIDAQEQSGWWNRLTSGWRPVLRPVAPLAAACAMVVAAVWLQTPAPVEPPAQAQGEVVEIEQVERALEDLEMLRVFASPPREAPSARSM